MSHYEISSQNGTLCSGNFHSSHWKLIIFPLLFFFLFLNWQSVRCIVCEKRRKKLLDGSRWQCWAVLESKLVQQLYFVFFLLGLWDDPVEWRIPAYNPMLLILICIHLGVCNFEVDSMRGCVCVWCTYARQRVWDRCVWCGWVRFFFCGCRLSGVLVIVAVVIPPPPNSLLKFKQLRQSTIIKRWEYLHRLREKEEPKLHDCPCTFFSISIEDEMQMYGCQGWEMLGYVCQGWEVGVCVCVCHGWEVGKCVCLSGMRGR